MLQCYNIPILHLTIDACQKVMTTKSINYTQFIPTNVISSFNFFDYSSISSIES